MTNTSQLFSVECMPIKLPDWCRVGFHRNDTFGIAHLQLGPINLIIDAGLGGHARFRAALLERAEPIVMPTKRAFYGALGVVAIIGGLVADAFLKVRGW